MERARKSRLFLVATALAAFLTSSPLFLPAQTDDPFAASLESAVRQRDGQQLESLKTQLEQRIRQNPKDAQSEYQLARVEFCLADVAERGKDKKAATAAIDRAIEAAQRSIQLNDKAADSHSLPEQFLSEAYGFRERIVSLDISVAELAARISIETKLAMADALIYAAAKAHRATLITSDTHFSGLDFVTLI